MKQEQIRNLHNCVKVQKCNKNRVSGSNWSNVDHQYKANLKQFQGPLDSPRTYVGVVHEGSDNNSRSALPAWKTKARPVSFCLGSDTGVETSRVDLSF